MLAQDASTTALSWLHRPSYFDPKEDAGVLRPPLVTPSPPLAKDESVQAAEELGDVLAGFDETPVLPEEEGGAPEAAPRAAANQESPPPQAPSPQAKGAEVAGSERSPDALVPPPAQLPSPPQTRAATPTPPPRPERPLPPPPPPSPVQSSDLAESVNQLHEKLDGMIAKKSRWRPPSALAKSTPSSRGQIRTAPRRRQILVVPRAKPELLFLRHMTIRVSKTFFRLLF